MSIFRPLNLYVLKYSVILVATVVVVALWRFVRVLVSWSINAVRCGASRGREETSVREVGIESCDGVYINIAAHGINLTVRSSNVVRLLPRNEATQAMGNAPRCFYPLLRCV